MTRTRRKGSRFSAKLQSSAMLDIVFLLLVYFIVTAKPQLLEAQVHTDVASADRSQPPVSIPATPLIVDVMPDGYRINSHFRDALALRDDLVMIATYSPETTVLIRVHPDAMNTQVMTLLDEATYAGLPKFAFAGAPESL